MMGEEHRLFGERLKALPLAGPDEPHAVMWTTPTDTLVMGPFPTLVDAWAGMERLKARRPEDTYRVVPIFPATDID